MRFHDSDGAGGERGSGRGAPSGCPSGGLASVELEARQYCVLLVRGVQQRRVFLRGEDSSEARVRLRGVIEKLPPLADSANDWFDFVEQARRLFAGAGFVRMPH
jgi:hypothetical protein